MEWDVGEWVVSLAVTAKILKIDNCRVAWCRQIANKKAFRLPLRR